MGKESMMPVQTLFGISIAFSLIAWGIVTAQYFWPAVRTLPLARALRPLLLLHSFRFIGLAFLVPGVVWPDLPAAFARPAAYGDLIAAVLALLSLATLHSRVGIVLVWVFNVWAVRISSSHSIKVSSVSGSHPVSWQRTSFRPWWSRCS
jgi:hypothetical protein